MVIIQFAQLAGFQIFILRSQLEGTIIELKYAIGRETYATYATCVSVLLNYEFSFDLSSTSCWSYHGSPKQPSEKTF